MEDRRNIFTVLKAQSGDRESLDHLFRSLQKDLFRYIRQIVGHRETAEDVLQDVFVIIQRQLLFLRDPEHFRAWCYRIASREAVRISKKERKRQNLMEERETHELPETGDDFQPEFIDREHLESLIDRVPPASRSVLALHYSESFTLPEIAGILGVPVGTAKSRLAYGLGVLRREMTASSPTTF